MPTPIGNIPASSIPAARAWILAGLQTQLAADKGVLVCLDEPGPYQPDDIIAVGDVHQQYNPENVVGSGGAYWLREDYTITVTVDVYRGGDDALGVFTRARQLADLVVAVVRSDPSLGGAVDRGKPGMVTHTSGWAEDHKGRQTVIEIGIDCLKTL
ncbi:hypothetical protein ABT167_27390 [Streptomyces sp. NPDC001792]|uniref:hypothetical protein n=1 Tax=Streptomyces sp. NPDC001792 TaxID=3154524 RepID=UPI00332845E0